MSIFIHLFLYLFLYLYIYIYIYNLKPHYSSIVACKLFTSTVHIRFNYNPLVYKIMIYISARYIIHYIFIHATSIYNSLSYCIINYAQSIFILNHPQFSQQHAMYASSCHYFLFIIVV
jgi:hypothetical protein